LTVRVTLIAAHMLGYGRANGPGTATTFLALALGRMGHQAEILFIGEPPAAAMDGGWARMYEGHGVSVRHLPRTHDPVEPGFFARMRDTELALHAAPPDVVITHDFGAPAYTALRLRRLDLAFENTLFVVFCHGTWRFGKEASRKVRLPRNALPVSVLEQASLELADVVVSPSAYMVEWMRGQGWRLPERTLVVPLLTRSGATGEPPEPTRVNGDGHVERVAFFGPLEERKGVRLFVAGVNALGPELLDGLEVEFIGKPTKDWDPERVEALVSETTRAALRSISFETGLDQREALMQLGRPGTLAVMPSLQENSPNTVYECLENGIPFIASHVGGIPELVAPEDRARVLIEPTPEGLAAALRRVLSAGGIFEPARPGFDPTASYERWAEVVATRPSKQAHATKPSALDVVVVHRGSNGALSQCLSALARQSYRYFRTIVVEAGSSGSEIAIPGNLERDAQGRPPVVVRAERASVEAARDAGLRAGNSPLVVFLDGEDVPEDELLDTLVRAQAASEADVVTCAVYLADGTGGRTSHFFLGQPGGLGLLSNAYGTVALLRRSLLGSSSTPWPVEGDPDWPLLAGLSVSGARIVSIPIPLVTRKGRPGSLGQQPSDGLLAVLQFERALPPSVASVARLTAGLAADSRVPRALPLGGIVSRAGELLRDEGLPGLVRRAGRRVGRGLSRSRR